MARPSAASSSSRAASAATTKLRCAIYTRKSSEEGLEQDFNSLDAQREACEAYILSQRHEGWIALPQMYDDGGISGGTIERPALKRLLADVASGKVDVVVVYKVDRLTRSLADFAKIVEIFDQRSVSFVSVTQAFNTTSSMGRLTLNVLLSFAQFEREVTGERIRDKIAASKKKGMWMGGLPPLGYDVQDRKLVVNPAEAKTVQLIFERYAALKSVRLLQAELDQRAIISKSRKRDNGSAYGGQPLGRGGLYAMLANRLYRGEIVHKGVSHPGQHDPIIDEVLFNDVQQILAANRASRERGTNADAPSLLAGLIFDADGNRMTPTHASKNGVRYRYYVSQTLIAARAGKADEHRVGTTSTAGTGQRLPAAGIERLVVDRLHQLLTAPTEMLALGSDRNPETSGPAVPIKASDQNGLLNAAHRQALSIGAADAETIRVFLLAVITRIDVHRERIDIRVSRRRLLRHLLSEQDVGIVRPNEAVIDAPACGDGSEPPVAPEAPNSGRPTTIGNDAVDEIILTIPIALKRAGIELRLVVPGSTSGSPPDETLVRIIAKAHQIRDRLFAEPELTVPMLAEREGVTKSYVTRLLRLAFLAPDIVMAMLEGRQPVELTANKLLADTRLAIAWAEQRQAIGFT
jgi:DNA invertase Pin-like site-specific DNA recombinase